MIIVSGMHRSGTSCITGLLERCGFSLGTSHPIHPIKNVWNPKGYFENMQMLAINDTILKHAGGRWDQVPPERNIEITGDRLAKAVSDFGTQFNGEVAKDPRTCVTIAV